MFPTAATDTAAKNICQIQYGESRCDWTWHGTTWDQHWYWASLQLFLTPNHRTKTTELKLTLPPLRFASPPTHWEKRKITWQLLLFGHEVLAQGIIFGSKRWLLKADICHYHHSSRCDWCICQTVCKVTKFILCEEETSADSMFPWRLETVCFSCPTHYTLHLASHLIIIGNV